MSETRLQVTLLGALFLIALLVLAAILIPLYFEIALLVAALLVFLVVVGFAIRKWQHSGLPVHENKREWQRLQLEQEHQAHTHQLEKERHEQELLHNQAIHEQSMQMQLLQWQLQQHLALTRVAYDDNGNPPVLLNQPDIHVTVLPAGMPPYRPLKEQIQPAQLAQQAESRLPVPYDLAQEWQRFRPVREQIFLARTAEGQVLVPLGKLWHIAFTGPTGGGKTSILRMIMMQLLFLRAEVVLCDIHYAPIKKDSNGQPIDWRPIEKRLKMDPIRDIQTIGEWINWLAFSELQARIDREYRGEPIGKPLFFTIEELPAVLDEAGPVVGRPLAKVLRQGRQYGICFLGASQDLLTNTLKMTTGPRECFRTGYYTGGDPTTAKALLDLRNGEKVDEDGLGVDGLVYLKTALHSAMQVRTPWASNEALYTLFQVPVHERLGNEQQSRSVPDMDPLPRARTAQYSETYSNFQPVPDSQVIEADSHQNGTSAKVLDFPQNTRTEPAERSDLQEKEYRLSDLEAAQFIAAYKASSNIERALSAIGRGARYKPHARELLEQHGLRKDA